MNDCQNIGCLAQGTEWCAGVSAPTDSEPRMITCYGYMPLAVDDLVPDKPIPDSAWTDKIPNDAVHVSTKFSK